MGHSLHAVGQRSLTQGRETNPASWLCLFSLTDHPATVVTELLRQVSPHVVCFHGQAGKAVSDPLVRTWTITIFGQSDTGAFEQPLGGVMTPSFLPQAMGLLNGHSGLPQRGDDDGSSLANSATRLFGYNN